MTREYKKWKNRSTNKNEQLLKIQHYIKVRLLHDRQTLPSMDESAHYIKGTFDSGFLERKTELPKFLTRWDVVHANDSRKVMFRMVRLSDIIDAETDRAKSYEDYDYFLETASKKSEQTASNEQTSAPATQAAIYDAQNRSRFKSVDMGALQREMASGISFEDDLKKIREEASLKEKCVFEVLGPDFEPTGLFLASDEYEPTEKVAVRFMGTAGSKLRTRIFSNPKSIPFDIQFELRPDGDGYMGKSRGRSQWRTADDLKKLAIEEEAKMAEAALKDEKGGSSALVTGKSTSETGSSSKIPKSWHVLNTIAFPKNGEAWRPDPTLSHDLTALTHKRNKTYGAWENLYYVREKFIKDQSKHAKLTVKMKKGVKSIKKMLSQRGSPKKSREQGRSESSSSSSSVASSRENSGAMAEASGHSSTLEEIEWSMNAKEREIRELDARIKFLAKDIETQSKRRWSTLNQQILVPQLDMLRDMVLYGPPIIPALIKKIETEGASETTSTTWGASKSTRRSVSVTSDHGLLSSKTQLSIKRIGVGVNDDGDDGKRISNGFNISYWTVEGAE